MKCVKQFLDYAATQEPAVTTYHASDMVPDGIVNLRVQPKRTKAVDMHFHCLRDRGVNQKQFKFYWHPGPFMRADYWTKHHSPSHHRHLQSEILTPYDVILNLRKKMAKIQYVSISTWWKFQITKGSSARVC